MKEAINSALAAEIAQNVTKYLIFSIGDNFFLAVPDTDENRKNFWNVVSKFI